MISPEPSPSNPPRLSNELIDAICKELGSRPSEIFVIYSAAHNSVLHDPMTKKPVHNKNRKVLESAAKEYGGIVIPLNEALRHIIHNFKPRKI